MKIETFDKHTCGLMRKEIDEALSSVGKKYGLTFQGGNIRYTQETFTMKISAATSGKNGQTEPIEVKDFKKYTCLHGLKESDLGKRFLAAGDSYVLVGYKPKSHKYPFVGVNAKGKRFKFTAETVKRGLGY